MKDLALTAVPGGTRLRLRVKPGGKVAAIAGVHGGALKITVSAPPERGKANGAVIDLLSKALLLSYAGIDIVRGAASQDKIVLVRLAPDEIRKRLAAALAARG